jgi:hypothetical protein
MAASCSACPATGVAGMTTHMIDRAARDRLARLVLQVATGEIWTSHCIEQARAIAAHTSDQGILVVLMYLESLGGGEDAILPKRFRGWRKLPRESLQRLATTIIFLCSDAEYEWPAFPEVDSSSTDCLLCWACGFLCVCGSMCVSGTACLLLTRHYVWGIIVGLVAALCAWGATKIIRLSVKWRAQNAAQWEQEIGRRGDYDVWPFLRWTDFTRACESPELADGVRAVLSSCSPPPCIA